MNILMYGAGAVGQTVGCLLAAHGHSVDLILRDRFCGPIRSGGLSVTGIFGDYSIDPGQIGAYVSINDIIDKRYDYAVITTKSYDTVSAIEALVSLRNQDFTAVSLQNGCGNLEKITDAFGTMRSLGGRVITGFEIEAPGKVTITVTADDVHIGGNIEGEIPASASRLAEAVDESGLPCAATAYIRRDLFAKLLYNCALNPLGAALGVHYGALGDNRNTRSVMDAVIDEVFAVITAMGATTHWAKAEEYRSFFYSTQLPATYNHRSSMLQDIEKGKRTEVDALTGYVGEMGDAYDVPTPVCDTLTSIIRFRERR